MPLTAALDRAALVVEVDELDVLESLELLLEQLAARAPVRARIAKGASRVRRLERWEKSRPAR
jgi:hypothetical protein